jgi:hypothetical protein
MFDDIHKVDSTVFKPNQTAPSREYRGNARKRREPSPNGADQNEPELNNDGEREELGLAAEPRHSLDIEA